MPQEERGTTEVKWLLVRARMELEEGSGSQFTRRHTVQSPIGAGLRRQELLRGRRDTPAKSSAAAETDNGCENSETVGLGEGFGD